MASESSPNISVLDNSNPVDLDNNYNGFHLCSCRGDDSMGLFIFIPDSGFNLIQKMLESCLPATKGYRSASLNYEAESSNAGEGKWSWFPLGGMSKNMFVLRTSTNESCRDAYSFTSPLIMPIPLAMLPMSSDSTAVTYVTDNPGARNAHVAMLRCAIQTATGIASSASWDDRTEAALACEFFRVADDYMTDYMESIDIDQGYVWTGLSPKIELIDISGSRGNPVHPRDMISRSPVSGLAGTMTGPTAFLQIDSRLYYSQEFSSTVISSLEIGGTTSPIKLTIGRTAYRQGGVKTDDELMSMLRADPADLTYRGMITAPCSFSFPPPQVIDRSVVFTRVVEAISVTSFRIDRTSSRITTGMTVTSSGVPSGTTITEISGTVLYVSADCSFVQGASVVLEMPSDIYSLDTSLPPFPSKGDLVMTSASQVNVPISPAYVSVSGNGWRSFGDNLLSFAIVGTTDSGVYHIQERYDASVSVADLEDTSIITSPLYAAGGISLARTLRVVGDSTTGGVSDIWLIAGLPWGSSRTPYVEIENYSRGEVDFFGTMKEEDALVLHPTGDEVSFSSSEAGMYLTVTSSGGIDYENAVTIGTGLYISSSSLFPTPLKLDEAYRDRLYTGPATARYKIRFNAGITPPAEGSSETGISVYASEDTSVLMSRSAPDSPLWCVTVTGVSGAGANVGDVLLFGRIEVGGRVMSEGTAVSIYGSGRVYDLPDDVSATLLLCAEDVSPADSSASVSGRVSLGTGSTVFDYQKLRRIQGGDDDFPGSGFSALMDTARAYSDALEGLGQTVVSAISAVNEPAWGTAFREAGLVVPGGGASYSQASTRNLNLSGISSLTGLGASFQTAQSNDLSSAKTVSELTAGTPVSLGGGSTPVPVYNAFTVTGLSQDPVEEDSITYRSFNSLSSPVDGKGFSGDGVSLLGRANRVSVSDAGTISGLITFASPAATALDLDLAVTCIRALVNAASRLRQVVTGALPVLDSSSPLMGGLQYGVDPASITETTTEKTFSSIETFINVHADALIGALTEMRTSQEIDARNRATERARTLLGKLSFLYRQALSVMAVLVPNEGEDSSPHAETVTFPFIKDGSIVRGTLARTAIYDGLWYYNYRKSVYAAMALCDLVVSVSRRATILIMAVLADMTASSLSSDSTYETVLHHFAYLDSGAPLYPIVKSGTVLSSAVAPRINSISLLFPEESLTYRLRANISTDATVGIESSDPSAEARSSGFLPMLLPGFGHSECDDDQLYCGEDVLPYSSGSGLGAFDDYYASGSLRASVTSAFTQLRNHVQPDYIRMSGTQMESGEVIRSGARRPVNTSAFYDMVTAGNSHTPASIRPMTVTGNIDASYVFPYITAPEVPYRVSFSGNANFLLGQPATISDLFTLTGSISARLTAFNQTKRPYDTAGSFEDEVSDLATRIVEYFHAEGDRVLSAIADLDYSFSIPFMGNANPILGTNDGESGLIVPAVVSLGACSAGIEGIESIITTILESGNATWETHTSTAGGQLNYNLNLSRRRAYYFALSVISELMPIMSVTNPLITWSGNTAIILSEEATCPSVEGFDSASAISVVPFRAYGLGAAFNIATADTQSRSYDYGKSVVVSFMTGTETAYPASLNVEQDGVTFVDGSFSAGSSSKTVVPETNMIIPGPGVVLSNGEKGSTTVTYMKERVALLAKHGAALGLPCTFDPSAVPADFSGLTGTLQSCRRAVTNYLSDPANLQYFAATHSGTGSDILGGIYLYLLPRSQ